MCVYLYSLYVSCITVWCLLSFSAVLWINVVFAYIHTLTHKIYTCLHQDNCITHLYKHTAVAITSERIL